MPNAIRSRPVLPPRGTRPVPRAPGCQFESSVLSPRFLRFSRARGAASGGSSWCEAGSLHRSAVECSAAQSTDDTIRASALNHSRHAGLPPPPRLATRARIRSRRPARDEWLSTNGICGAQIPASTGIGIDSVQHRRRLRRRLTNGVRAIPRHRHQIDFRSRLSAATRARSWRARPRHLGAACAGSRGDPEDAVRATPYRSRCSGRTASYWRREAGRPGTQY